MNGSNRPVLPLLFASLLPVLLACAGARRDVPLFGDPAALAGSWAGRYVSEETGRAGTIDFQLTAGRDTARGDVVMLVPRTSQEAPAFVPAGGAQVQPLAPAHDARVLTIRFVQVEDGGVRGRLDPYTDPACGCTVETVFEGRLQGNVIRGGYVTRHLERPHLQRGRWQVRRK